jgi:aspartate-semialdehyde dehydrogenase
VSVVALVNPATLLGQGVRESLGARGFEDEVRLLATEADAEGTLTEVGGEVALVQALSREALAGVDLVIVCGTPQEQRNALALVPDGIPTIVVANQAEHPDGLLAVAGITDPASLGRDVIVSPHPGVIVLCHLLATLTDLRPSRIAATVLLPTSMREAAGLDELFAQTRDILNFQADPPKAIFGHQLAFNLLPVSDGRLGDDIRTLLGVQAEIALQLVQAPVFHSLAVSATVQLEATSSVDDVLEALHSSPAISIAESAEILGPIDAAAREEILIGPITPVPGWQGAYSIWAVMDNLTRGGASNAVEIAVQLLS